MVQCVDGPTVSFVSRPTICNRLVFAENFSYAAIYGRPME